MMSDLKVSVTICSWNTLGDLRTCLESLEKVQDEGPFEVIVFDNNSADGSPDMVESEFPWVRLIRSSRNLGFTGGQNHAVVATFFRLRRLCRYERTENGKRD